MDKLLSYWKERLQSLSAYLLIIAIVAGMIFVGSLFRKPRQQATSSTRTNVAAGGTANITNINNPLPDLHEGIYGRVSSDRASIGVFKEVTPAIDVEIGGGKSYDKGEFAEVSLRYKF